MMLWSELSKIIIVVVFLVKVINSDFGDIRTEGVDSDVIDVIREENESYKVKRENHRNETELHQKEEDVHQKEREMHRKEKQSIKREEHRSGKERNSKKSGKGLNKQKAKKQTQGLIKIKKRKSKIVMRTRNKIIRRSSTKKEKVSNKSTR